MKPFFQADFRAAFCPRGPQETMGGKHLTVVVGFLVSDGPLTPGHRQQMIGHATIYPSQVYDPTTQTARHGPHERLITRGLGFEEWEEVR